MTHPDHVRLIERGVPHHAGGVWADFGSGEGAFTLALRDIAGDEVELYSIDENTRSLAAQERHFHDQFPDTNIHFINADFTDSLDLLPLDGLVAANSIHYHRDTLQVLRNLTRYLKPNAPFIVVEYNTDHGNTWVPHPFSFPTFAKLAKEAGLKTPELLATNPSDFLNEIYAAKAYK